MNLLTSSWIPVRKPDGQVSTISIAELPTSGALEVAHPRADFSALITELLVTIFQTAGPPSDARKRLKWFSQPAVVPFDWIALEASAFELLEGPSRFMQSPEPLGAALPVGFLMYDGPAENTIKNNKDVLVHRDAVKQMCPCCAGISVFLNQAHPKEGGQGYYLTTRGRNSLTALLEGRTLWETVLLNVLPKDTYLKNYGTTEGSGYPWTNGLECFNSDKVHPTRFGPHAALWWCPLALHLVSEPSGAGVCDACGASVEGSPVVTHVHKAATKLRQPLSEHPLTAWTTKEVKNEEKQIVLVRSPARVPSNGVALDGWPSLMLGVGAAGTRLPALNFVPHTPLRDSVTVWTFGPNMNKSSQLNWHNFRAPSWVLDADQVPTANALVASLLPEMFGVSWNLRDVLLPVHRKKGRAPFLAVSQFSATSAISDWKDRDVPHSLPSPVATIIAEFENNATAKLIARLQELELDPEEGLLVPAKFKAAYVAACKADALAVANKALSLDSSSLDALKRVVDALNRAKENFKTTSRTSNG